MDGSVVAAPATTNTTAATGRGRERVIYFSFYIQSALRELFTNPKEDKRIFKIQIVCHCQFRLSKELSSVPHFHLVEAFLDQEQGNFDGCVHMLDGVFKGVGYSLNIHRTINMNVYPNGSYDYKYYCNETDHLTAEVSNGMLQIHPGTGDGIYHSDSMLSDRFSVSNSTMSSLFKELENNPSAATVDSQTGGATADTASHESLTSLQEFICLEMKVCHLERIAGDNYDFVIEEMFLEALTDEMDAETWYASLRRVLARQLNAVTRERVASCGLVCQALAMLAKDLVDPVRLVERACSDCFDDNFTIVCTNNNPTSRQGGTTSRYDNNNSSCFCGAEFDYHCGGYDDESTELQGNSTVLDFSESLICPALTSQRDAPMQAPLPLRRSQLSLQTPTRGLAEMHDVVEDLFSAFCDEAVAEVGLETLVQLVSQRLVMLLYRRSSSKSRFECRIVKALTSFNQTVRQLELRIDQLDMASLVDAFFGYVVDTASHPDNLSVGLATGLVEVLQASTPETASFTRNLEYVNGWRLLQTMRIAYEDAVREQLARLGGKLQRQRQNRRCQQLGAMKVAVNRHGTLAQIRQQTAGLFSTTQTESESTADDVDELPSLLSDSSPWICTATVGVGEAMGLLLTEKALPLTSSDIAEVANVLSATNPPLNSASVFIEAKTNEITVWKTMSPAIFQVANIQSYNGKSSQCLTLTLPNFLYASRLSTSRVVDDTVRSVVDLSGNILAVCTAISGPADIAVVAETTEMPLTHSLAEFVARTLTLAEAPTFSVSLQQPRLALRLASCRPILVKLDATSQPPVVIQRSPNRLSTAESAGSYLKNAKCSTTVTANAFTINAGVRPSCSHCCPLSLAPPPLMAGEAPHRPSTGSRGLLIVATAAKLFELTSASAIRMAAMMPFEGPRNAATTAWPVRRSSGSFESTPVKPLSLIHVDGANSEASKSRQAVSIRVPERALVHLGGDYPETSGCCTNRPVCEWRWAGPASCLRSTLTGETSVAVPRVHVTPSNAEWLDTGLSVGRLTFDPIDARVLARHNAAVVDGLPSFFVNICSSVAGYCATEDSMVDFAPFLEAAPLAVSKSEPPLARCCFLVVDNEASTGPYANSCLSLASSSDSFSSLVSIESEEELMEFTSTDAVQSYSFLALASRPHVKLVTHHNRPDSCGANAWEVLDNSLQAKLQSVVVKGPVWKTCGSRMLEPVQQASEMCLTTSWQQPENSLESHPRSTNCEAVANAAAWQSPSNSPEPGEQQPVNRQPSPQMTRRRQAVRRSQSASSVSSGPIGLDELLNSLARQQALVDRLYAEKFPCPLALPLFGPRGP